MSVKRTTSSATISSILDKYKRVKVLDTWITLKQPSAAALQRVTSFIKGSSFYMEKEEKKKTGKDESTAGLTFLADICAVVVVECVEGVSSKDAPMLVAAAGGLSGELMEKCFGMLGLSEWYKSASGVLEAEMEVEEDSTVPLS